MKQGPAYSRGINSKMNSIITSSILISIIPMLMPAFNGMELQGYALPVRLANAVRELANVFHADAEPSDARSCPRYRSG